MQFRSMRKGLMAGWLVLAGLAFTGVATAEEAAAPAAAEHEAEGVNWQGWMAGNEVSNTASLQRGASNFVNYCLGCHSLKYMRWSRLGEDLNLSDALLRDQLLPVTAKPTDYVLASFPKADAEAWFGKSPPDLSLVARSRGPDWVYRFLKGFYADPTRPTGSNNLELAGAAMPAVLSDLEGVKAAVFAEHAAAAEGGHGGPQVAKFETLAEGRLTPAQFDGFVRDTVNFLDYVGDPAQVERRGIGIWAVLFLLVFTAFAYLLKKEYWKDVH